VDGKTHSLSDFARAKAVVLIFTCNSCPYAVDYEERFKALTSQHQQNPAVAVIAINSNLTRADSLEEMQKRAKDQQFPFVYLFDESQQLAKQIGALRTPECFVLNEKRQIVYMGAFDDNTDASKVKHQYVSTAVDQVLAGNKPEPAETPPIGCLIRFKRTR